MAFTDYMGQYFQNRMDQATRPFTDTEGYMAERLGFETEEERRKRLEREAAQRGNTEVASTTVKSYADGSQEEVVKTQIPAAQPVTAPVAPDDIYNRMIQAESGGRQFNAQGGVLTSPKGAMGVGQVMPTTAMQPGYGVTNIFDMAQQRGMPVAQRDEATARQLLGNEQLNRDFGQSYFNAMQQRFPGQPEASVAAYNAGPGRVGQNMQANAGQLNTSQLPNETQAYIQSVLNRQPQAQAQTQTQMPQTQVPQPQAPTQLAQEPPGTPMEAAPVAPTALVQEPPAPAPASTQPMIAGTPSSDVGLTPTEQAINQQRAYWANDLEKAQNDSTSLYAIAGNKERYPEEVRNIARDKAVELDSRKAQEEKAKKIAEGAATGDPKATNDLMRAIKTKSEDGSYVKAYLFSRLGLNQLAQEEQSKLSGPKFGQVTADGKSYFVETKGGAITGAFDNTGARIKDDATLAKINTSYIDLTKGSSAGSTTFTDPVTKQTLTKVDTLKGPIWYDKAGVRTVPKGEPIPNTIGGNLDLQNQLQLQSIRNKLTGLKSEERIKTLEAENRVRMAEGKPLWDLNAVGLSPKGDWLVSPTGAAPGGETTGSISRTAKAEGTKTETIAKAEGEVGAKDVRNQAFADSSYSLIKPISDAIKQSTGSAIGSGVDTLNAAFSRSTEGARAIAKLDVLGYSLVSNVPRFEGPQGVRDVELYERAAGDLANSKKPVETRLAALDAILILLKKYDKAGTNDWSFGGTAPTSDAGSPQDKARAEIERRKKDKK
jgi:hypothetical protein